MVLDANPNWYGVRHPEWQAPGATYPTEGEPEDEIAGRLDPSVVGKPLPTGFLSQHLYPFIAPPKNGSQKRVKRNCLSEPFMAMTRQMLKRTIYRDKYGNPTIRQAWAKI